ncbi:MAG: LemA family protein [Syntrophothermus sp.]|nr:LemA family protein [Ignavibacteriaceae bacterium]
MKRTGLIGCGAAIILIVLILVIWGISSYNGMVNLNEQVNSSWSQVENQYQRRTDLIPNLVNTVKGYASHERQTLEAVINARARATSINLTPEALNDPKALQRFDQIQGELSSALSRLLAVSENYPNLKANENFNKLQDELAGTENRIAVERQRFNTVVQDYNVRIKRFPGSIFAGMFGFHEKAYFRSTTGSETPPKVEF